MITVYRLVDRWVYCNLAALYYILAHSIYNLINNFDQY